MLFFSPLSRVPWQQRWCEEQVEKKTQKKEEKKVERSRTFYFVVAGKSETQEATELFDGQ